MDPSAALLCSPGMGPSVGSHSPARLPACLPALAFLQSATMTDTTLDALHTPLLHRIFPRGMKRRREEATEEGESSRSVWTINVGRFECQPQPSQPLDPSHVSPGGTVSRCDVMVMEEGSRLVVVVVTAPFFRVAQAGKLGMWGEE